MVIKRALAHWRLLSAVVIGVLLACAIMAGTTIYFESLRELALRKTIEQQAPTDLDIVVGADRGPTTRAEQQKVVAAVERESDAWLSWFVHERFPLGRSATFFVSDPGREGAAGQDNRRAYFSYALDFDELTTLVHGAKPSGQAVLTSQGERAIEVLIPDTAAEQYGIAVGDRFSAVPFWKDDASHANVIVTGIFHRSDPAHPLWTADALVLEAATGLSFVTMPFYVSEETFFDVLGTTFRDMDSTYAWVLDVNTDTLHSDNALAAVSSIRTVQESLSSQLFSYRQFTELNTVLTDYDERLFYTKLPMIIVLILIAFVILYYVLTLSSLLVEQQRGEITLLRSRGAGPVHLLTVFALEGGSIALIGGIFGPLIASSAISLAGYTPAFSDLTGGSALSTSISGISYAMSAIGGLFSFGALMIPAIGIARSGVAQQRQESSRPGAQPFYQRYYLDVLLLVFSIFLFRQLTEQGSFVATEVFGDQTVNQMLLAVPAITLLAAALVLLRLFPILMEFISKIFSRWMPAGLVLAIWNMARNPTHYARLALLLILTAGLGIFAASFGGTLERNFEERALYQSAGHIRVDGLIVNNFGDTVPIAPVYEAIAGVDGVALAYSGFGYDASKITGEDFTFLTLDSNASADFIWTRSDFASKPIPEMLRSLPSVTMPQGIDLPINATSIGISVNPDRPQSSVVVTLRAIDANERWFTYRLGGLTSADWQTLEGSLAPEPSRFGRVRLRPTYPLRLMSVAIMQADVQRGLLPGSILLDDLYVRTDTGETVMLETFDSVESWNTLRVTPQALTDTIEMNGDSIGGSAGSLRFSWFEGPALTARGVYLGPKLEPLSILVNEQFVGVTGHDEGDTFDMVVSSQRVPVRIAGVIDYFPPLDTENELVVIADFQSTIMYANLDPSDSELRPNQAWLASSLTGPARTQFVQSLKETPFPASAVFDLQELQGQQEIDPLTRAGWRSLLFIAFGAVLILSCVGFIVHAYVSFQNRRRQFALLHTIGLSARQLITVVFIEQAFVVAAGIALGGWMGGRLGAIVMPFFANDDRGSQVLPPFVLQVDWPILLITYGIMVGVFTLATIGVIMFARRISVARTLRLGEL